MHDDVKEVVVEEQTTGEDKTAIEGESTNDSVQVPTDAVSHEKPASVQQAVEETPIVEEVKPEQQEVAAEIAKGEPVQETAAEPSIESATETATAAIPETAPEPAVEDIELAITEPATKSVADAAEAVETVAEPDSQVVESTPEVKATDIAQVEASEPVTAKAEEYLGSRQAP